MRLPTSNRRLWALAVLGLGAISAATWWIAALHAKDAESLSESPVMLRHEGARLFVPERSPLRNSLALQTVAEQAITAPFVLPAVVEADPGKLVKVLPPIAGRIVRLNKRLGDAVKAGDTLFAIDSSDLAQALSDAKKAESALALARQNLARQRDLESTNIAAKRDLEQAQNDYEQAASELGRANARLAELGITDTRLASGSTLTVRSPISGRVVELNAGNGGYWNDTTAPIMTVADLSTVFVTGSAQEKDLGHLYVGQEATVALDAYPNQPLRGKVQYVAELLDPDTRTVKIRMIFDNREGRLKPGMFAKAVYRERPHKGILVPISAVVQSGFYSRTFVEVEPWRFEPRVLQLGAQFDNQVEVLSGVKPGERIVVKDGLLLND